MNPDADARFALLASGADFSREVLACLNARGCPPSMLVLPEYPPAEIDAIPLAESPVTRDFLQLEQGIEVAYAPAARQHEFADLVNSREFDFLLVACWPYLLAPRLIDSPACATLNLHPSLLPAYRGADPLGQQLASGDRRFGVSLHLLDQRFDHGDIVAQAALPALPANHNRAVIEQECARVGVDLFIDAMSSYPRWRPRRQAG